MNSRCAPLVGIVGDLVIWGPLKSSSISVHGNFVAIMVDSCVVFKNMWSSTDSTGVREGTLMNHQF